MKSCNFIITINNPKEDIHGVLERVKAAGFTYCRAQMERGDSGTLHIQAAFGGKSTRCNVVAKLFPTAHIEPAKNALAAWEYCGKEDTRVEGPVEYGVPPAKLNVKGDKKKRNAMLLEKGPEKAVEDGDICLLQYAKLKHNIDLYKSVTRPLADLDELNNQWIWGPPGVGKSRGVRQEYTSIYNKPLNKWWDDYNGQECVLLDDFSKEHACLGPHLKQWADHYVFTAEVKGGATKLRPPKIVVTSNYHPQEIWPQDEMMREAIERRFDIIHK